MRVALDDGHGTETPGKRTPKFPDGSFMHEHEFNSAVVDIIAGELKRHSVDVVLTVTEAYDVPLQTRCDIANREKADIFVSVHANAYGDGVNFNEACGIDTFHYPNSVEGKRLAECIHKYLMQGTPLENRGVKTATWHVLKYTHMPAVLCECGFMTNLHEAKMLMSDWYRQECAKEITQGILEYLGVKYIPLLDYKVKYEALKEALRDILEKL